MKTRLVAGLFAIGAGIVLALLLGYTHVATRIGALLSPDAAQAAPAPAPAPVPPTMVGITLSTLNFYTAEWPFNDLIQSTGTLLYLSPRSWDPLDGKVKLDATGHPVDVPAGTRLMVILQKGTLKLPLGTYNCRISPGWTVSPYGNWQMSGSGTSFRMKINNPEPGREAGVGLILTAQRSNAALTELSCRPVDDTGALFNPTFLADLKPYRVLRFMDWMHANNAPPRKWSSRPTPAFFSQAGPEGVAIEYIVALVNAAKADPWINLPLDADEQYYRNLAIYVRDHVDRDRHIYVELSNEVWNTTFEQGKLATARGQARYPGVPADKANDFYYADRVRETMVIWSEVFAGQPGRLVRVLSSQAVSPRRAEQALDHKETWKSVDALATAPYFGVSGNEIAASGSARVDAVFANSAQIVDRAIGFARAGKAVARAHGLRYITYEGGPGFQSFRPGVAQDMIALNHDQRLYGMYMQYLRRWRSEIGDLLMVLGSMSTPSVAGGSYGHQDYTGQPLADAPKARAVSDFVKQ
ncbi:MAG: hypothetical protein QM688_06890 [Sphingomonas bacterium]